MTEKQNFDPSKYLMRLERTVKGKKVVNDYLPVQWRVVWLREVAPDAQLETEHIRIDDLAAIFKATVTLPSGAKATGYGNVPATEFGDYIGKAETVAVGRALANLGFGTAFAGDYGDETGPVDTPTQRQAKREGNPDDNVVSIAAGPAPKRQDDEAAITPDVVAALIEAARKNGWSESALATEARRLYQQADLAMLTVGQGRELYRWAVKAKAS